MAARVGQIVGRPPAKVVDDYDVEEWALRLGDGDQAFIAVADLEDDRGMPLSRYRYLAQVQSVRDGRRDYDAQERVARGLYDRLTAATDWALLLAFNDGQQFVACRDVSAAA